jgi:hypothetical protein
MTTICSSSPRKGISVRAMIHARPTPNTSARSVLPTAMTMEL